MTSRAVADYVPWTDRDIDRFTKRVLMFKRRGCSSDKAELLAETLVARDRDGDDRRFCLECEHLCQDGTCFAALRGRIAGIGRLYTPVQDMLQRCPSFKFQIP